MPNEAEDTTKEEALGHVLQKWTGMTWAAMDRHRVVFCKCKLQNLDADDDSGNGEFDHVVVDMTTCALCEHYFDDDADDTCEHCPLTQIRGVPCDTDVVGDDGEVTEQAPYGVFTTTGDPQPMLELIVAAVNARLDNLERDNARLLASVEAKKPRKKPACKC